VCINFLRFKIPGRLLQEENFRKKWRSFPKLVKSIRTQIRNFEDENDERFTIDGESYLEILDEYGRCELSAAQKTKEQQVCFDFVFL